MVFYKKQYIYVSARRVCWQGLFSACLKSFDYLWSILLQWGFNNSKSDISLFIYKKDQVLLLCLVYVDYIVLTGNNPVLITKLNNDLNQMFAFKELGSLHYFLGIEAFRDSIGLYLC